MIKIKRIWYCLVLGFAIVWSVEDFITICYSVIAENYAKAIWNLILLVIWIVAVIYAWDKLN